MPANRLPIPWVDLSACYDPASSSTARAEAVEELGRACEHVGFAYIAGFPGARKLQAKALELGQTFFSLSEAVKRAVATRTYSAENPNRYRGYFPPVEGDLSFKEGFEIGVSTEEPPSSAGFFAEANPWPAGEGLSAWRAEVQDYGARLQALGLDLMVYLGDYLGIDRDQFQRAFQGSISTLRFIRYPEAQNPAPNQDGASVSTPDHTDSGCLTILNQDSTGGLQVFRPDDGWVDAPPVEGSFVINVGDLLQFWSEGRLRATRHRVLKPASERYSVPFFFEPSADARITPVFRGDQGDSVLYGSYVIEKMKTFVEYQELTREWEEAQRQHPAKTGADGS